MLKSWLQLPTSWNPLARKIWLIILASPLTSLNVRWYREPAGLDWASLRMLQLNTTIGYRLVSMEEAHWRSTALSFAQEPEKVTRDWPWLAPCSPSLLLSRVSWVPWLSSCLALSSSMKEFKSESLSVMLTGWVALGQSISSVGLSPLAADLPLFYWPPGPDGNNNISRSPPVIAVKLQTHQNWGNLINENNTGWNRYFFAPSFSNLVTVTRSQPHLSEKRKYG